MKKILKAYKKTISIVDESPVQIYKAIGFNKIGFLMESNDKENGRFTFMGVEPEQLIHSDNNSLVIEYKNGEKRIIEGNPMEALKEYYDEFKVIQEKDNLEMLGGLVGNIGYDFIRYREAIPDNNPDSIGIETIQLMLATKYIAIDHMAETCTIVILDEDTVEAEKEADKEADNIIKNIRNSINNNDENISVHDGIIVDESDTLDEYCKKIEKIKKYIKDGHVFQTVLSQRWTVQTQRTGFEMYCELRTLNPSPYLYYYNFGEFEIIGSSPEMLVKLTDNKIYTCPIAGTRPRGTTKEEDKKLEYELLHDKKEKAEHVMLVDLARNDCGRVSKIGSVKVSQFMNIQKYSHVMHIVSLVEGRKLENIHPIDMLASFLPAGTLSGAPKIRAMEIIDELEKYRRGCYGGATGYIAFNGNMNMCITIRTMVKKKNLVYLQAGAGIVADSIPENEYNECRNKVMALAKVLLKREVTNYDLID